MRKKIFKKNARKQIFLFAGTISILQPHLFAGRGGDGGVNNQCSGRCLVNPIPWYADQNIIFAPIRIKVTLDTGASGETGRTIINGPRLVFRN
jgi:hypothetical protein